MEENDKSSLLEKARDRLMEVGGEVSRLKTEASQAVEDGVVAARRLAKRLEKATDPFLFCLVVASRDGLRRSLRRLRNIFPGLAFLRNKPSQKPDRECDEDDPLGGRFGFNPVIRQKHGEQCWKQVSAG